MSYSFHIIICSFFFLFLNSVFAETENSESSKTSKYGIGPVANSNEPPKTKPEAKIEADTPAPATTTTAPVEKQEETVDPSTYLFNFEPSLNVSLGIEINKGDTYLIVEMDHNPTRDDFTFRYDLIAPSFKAALVRLENGPFGFHNKPVVRLPMIELEPSVTSSAKFIIDAKNHRTHQRINLTKILRELEAKVRLIDIEAQPYRAQDITEISILATKPVAKDNNVKTIHEIKIDFKKYPENKVHQIFGEQTLADITEQAEYQVGDEIKLKPHFKIPHRSSETQWIINPELSTDEFLVYRLISNPKVGDLYTIPVGAELIERVLPKVKPGNVWMKISQDETSITYSLANETAKLSPNILLRYVKKMLILATAEEDKGGDAIAVMKKSILEIPINFHESRIENLFNVILGSTEINEIVRALLIEQNYVHDPYIKPTSGANMCSGFLN